MKVGRLLRILWERRLIVATPVAGTLLGAIIIILTLPPRYEASTRVILEVAKPDPVTGFRVSDRARDAYVASQINMLRTDEVTERVVEASGWLQNPDLVAAWQASPDKGDDLRRWAGRRLAASIGADVVPDTDIMEIKYQSASPDAARQIADNIRTAFIEASIDLARASARGQATNLSAQAERERQRLVELQTFKADLERQTGIMLSENGTTMEAQKALQAVRVLPRPSAKASTARNETDALKTQLQNIDSSIVSAGRTLGPNNPLMMEMHRRREFVAALVAGAKPADPVSDMAMKRLEVASSLARQSVDRIHTVSDKTLALRLVQDEIKRRRALFDRAAEKAGQQLVLSNVSDANLTPIGATTVAPAPVFPNYALVLGVGGALGFVMGVLLAFIVEALARRVRSVDDLRAAVAAPLLGVLPAIPLPKPPAAVDEAKRARTTPKPKAARSKAKLARA